MYYLQRQIISEVYAHTRRKYCFAYDHAYSVESADHCETQSAIFLSIA